MASYPRQFLRHLHATRSLHRQVPTARVPLAFELHNPPNRAVAHRPTTTTTSPILFLHGFLGSKRENRHISRELANRVPVTVYRLLAQDLSRPVYTLDMRNHGDSPHHPKHDYMEMALDVKSFIEQHKLQSPTVIGHSMGAKTALTLALESPNLVKDILAIDNCPIHLPLEPEFQRYLEGLARLRDERVSNHQEADRFLARYEESPSIRLWLISNLVKNPNTSYLDVRVPVETLFDAVGPLGEFPYTEDELQSRNFHGRTLFLRALRSHYIPEEAFPVIYSGFPAAKIVDVDSGHWIVQERAGVFRKVTTEFLSSG
ncbi:alpha/beta-hydrolase [Aspergillus sclerotiicarbonarius CBS 121057]|uniref:Alpha/beta-hydrolase n=1 Tax=Aspergillus sclerotiicarbonarius (strain CBS 121057 / IBT 28362) TaxID=1448318 RepID=A0A319EFM7_ASPSB|nr:alpha/beta-hydrolase [Aspergillus sclerotiicarbonarius CBS 121057]